MKTQISPYKARQKKKNRRVATKGYDGLGASMKKKGKFDVDTEVENNENDENEKKNDENDEDDESDKDDENGRRNNKKKKGNDKNKFEKNEEKDTSNVRKRGLGHCTKCHKY